jgi:hypothetical protein
MTALRQRIVVSVVSILVGLVAFTSAGGALRLGVHASQTSAQTNLCEGEGTFVPLSVGRSGARKTTTYAFPDHVVSNDRSHIKNFVQALCHLPAVPKGTTACPNDTGVRYTLRFGREAIVRVSSAVIDPGGCRTVAGAGPLRWAINRPGFWTVFGAAIGLHNATNSTFIGSSKR